MNDNPFLDAPVEKKGSRFISILQFVAVLVVILMISWVVLLEQSQVKGVSMLPNFVNDQFLLVNRIPNYLGNSGLASAIGADYQRGDVVVFRKPGFEDFVKRVIGLPGESIQIREGSIFIDGRKLVEEYLPNGLYTNGGTLIVENGNPIVIPPNQYALIGDNRPQSNDSRFVSINFIQREWIKGKVFLRIWPFEDFSFIGQGRYTLE